MQQLTYINLRGESIVFGGEGPYILEHAEGLGAPDVKFTTTRGVGQHGDTPRKALREPRFVTLTFHTQGRDRSDLYAQRLAAMGKLALPRAFDGERQGRLVYANDYGAWWCHAIPDGPDHTKRMQDWSLSTKLTLRCSSPYWRTMDASALTLEMGGASFALPFRFPIRFGRRRFTGEALNAGHVETPVRIEVAGSGEMPTLINRTTGARLAVSRAVATGETLLIDTDPDRLAVTLRAADGAETDAYGYLDISSALTGFTLQTGANALEYLPSAPSSSSRVTVSWETRLEGL